MREIKFRAWDGKKMFQSYSLDNYGEMCSDADFINDVENPGRSAVQMQYTGLKDRHGKEIYEGDIFITGRDGKRDMLGEIYFDEGCFKMKYGYKNPSEKERKDYFLSGNIENDGAEIIEVIGNIYENKELLI